MKIRLRKTQSETNRSNRAGHRAITLRQCADPKRRIRYESKPANWLRHYLGAAFPLPFSPIHHGIIESGLYNIENGGNMIAVCPRGYGKTTVLCGLMFYAVVTQRLLFPAIIPATGPDAKKILKALQTWLCYVEPLAADYPEYTQVFNYSRGSSQRLASTTYEHTGDVTGASIQLQDGVITLPAGLGFYGCRTITGAIRGLFATSTTGAIVRPDFALLDDPQTRESANSETQTQTRVETIDGDVAGMAGPNKALPVFQASTFINTHDLTTHYAQHDNYEHQVFSLVDGLPSADSEQMKEWEKYNDVRLEGNAKKDRGKSARKYFREHRKALCDGWTVAWKHCVKPERNEVDAYHNALNEYFILGRASFMAEKQGTPEIVEDTALYDLTPSKVLSCLNGLERRTKHPEGRYVTVGIDVNWRNWGLSWALLHTQTDMGGHIMDWGVYPGGGRALWQDGDTVTPEEAMYSGVLDLVRQLRDRLGSLEINAVGVDVGYAASTVYRAVAQANRESPFLVVAMKGFPANKYRRPAAANLLLKKGDECHKQIGNLGTVCGFNSHAWHFRMQTAFLKAPGSSASLALWGLDPVPHRTLAQHVCAEKLAGMKENPATGQVEYNWTYRPERNDLGDAVVMAMVAANLEGARYDDRHAKAQAGETSEGNGGIIRIGNSGKWGRRR